MFSGFKSSGSVFHSGFTSASASAAASGSARRTATKSPSFTTFTPGRRSAPEVSAFTRVAPCAGGWRLRALRRAGGTAIKEAREPHVAGVPGGPGHFVPTVEPARRFSHHLELGDRAEHRLL